MADSGEFDFADVVEAARRRRILLITEAQRRLPDVTITTDKAPAFNIAVPMFDYGYGFDPDQPDSILHEVETMAEVADLPVYQKASALVPDGRLRLPFEDCVFVLRLHPWLDGPAIVVLKQNPDGIQMQIMMRFHDHWLLLPIDFGLKYKGEPNAYVRFFENSKLDAYHRDWFQNVGVMTTMLVTLCLTMLEAPDSTELAPVSPRMAEVNRGRERGKLDPVPRIRVIRWSREAVKYVRDRVEAAYSVIPHDRREHDRTLPSGRKIRVRASKIHGGSEAAPHYLVKK